MCENDEIRMAKLERVTNDQMTKRSRSWTSSFGLRHSFVIRNSGFVICLLILTTGISVAFAQKRNITEKDLWDFVWIGDPQVSPDGSRVAFVRVTVNEKKEGYNTSIWFVPAAAGGEEPHKRTKDNHGSTRRWSPNGKYLLFLRATEKDGKPEPPQLSMLPMAGGDSFSFTDLPKGAGSPVWSPDGKSIAFTSDTNADDLAKQEKKKRKEEELKKAVSETSASPSASSQSSKTPNPKSATGKSDADEAAKKAEAEAEHESDIHVIMRAVYREDNEGYADPKHPTHIWMIQAPRSADEKVQPKQLTTGRFDEGGILWAKDGSRIYFISLHVDEPYYERPKSELYSISSDGGDATKLNSFDMDMNNMSLSPDGKQIAF